MKANKQNSPLDALGEAYEKMYEHLAADFHQLKEKSGPALNKLIEDAKHKIIKLEEVTEHDAEQLAKWLKRDLSDLAGYLSETQLEVKDWLGFETSLLESAVFDLFLKAADKATIELIKFKEQALQPYTYHTGEMTIGGTLVCDHCDEKLHFYQAGKIPPCPKCHKTAFHRDSVY